MIENDTFDVIRQMHCLITFGTAGGTIEQVASIHKSIEDALKAHSHYKALGNTYIIKINSSADWQMILQKIQPIAQHAPIPMNFIMTPLMQAGNAYNGWMPKTAWDEMNKLTT